MKVKLLKSLRINGETISAREGKVLLVDLDSREANRLLDLGKVLIPTEDELKIGTQVYPKAGAFEPVTEPKADDFAAADKAAAEKAAADKAAAEKAVAEKAAADKAAAEKAVAEKASAGKTKASGKSETKTDEDL